jgi:hypothetical protein
VSKQPDGRLVEIALILFQADDQIPADLLRQLEDRGLGVESVQLKDVEETATVELGDFAQQAQGGRVLALVGLQPLQKQKDLTGLLMIWQPTARW